MTDPVGPQESPGWPEPVLAIEELFGIFVDHSPDIQLLVDPHGVVRYVNSAVLSVLGFPPGEVVGRKVREFVHVEDHPGFDSPLQGREERRVQRARFRHRSGAWNVLEGWIRPVRSRAGVPLLAASLCDATDRKRGEDVLIEAAFRDPLTHLPNRALFLRRLEQAVERARSGNGNLFAVLFMDLDRFKLVNDSFGHAAGDELLRVVAERIQECLRPGDVVSRFGGDEFAILVEQVENGSDVPRIAGRIQAALSSPVDLGGYKVFTSTSIGIALYSSPDISSDQLLRSADTAMYRAKAGGRARYEVFDRAMHAQTLQRLQFETDLQRAVERDQLRVHYQPVIVLKDGRVCGFEALLRWGHPERGSVSAGEFIPVAEEMGLILPVGERSLVEACQALRAWLERFAGRPGLSVAVNLSAKQFSYPGLVKHVRRTLAEADLRPGALKLEITESAVISGTGSVLRTLQDLKSTGVDIHMDNFGTGYSSLSYLHQLPLDALKIDRSLIHRMPADHKALQLVQSILALARSVGIPVIAEGVETKEQLEILRALGCEYAQGYLFSAPVDGESAERMLEMDQIW